MAMAIMRPLPLAARHLVRIAVEPLRGLGDADVARASARPRSRACASRHAAMQAQRLGDLLADRA